MKTGTWRVAVSCLVRISLAAIHKLQSEIAGKSSSASVSVFLSSSTFVCQQLQFRNPLPGLGENHPYTK